MNENSDPIQGQVWVYRKRDTAVSEQVLIESVHREQHKFRVGIRFLSGEKQGVRENVPRIRLKVPWVEVETYDALMDGLEKLRLEEVSEPEQRALWIVMDLLMHVNVAELFSTPVDEALIIHDQRRFAELVGEPLANLQQNCVWITFEEKVCFSPRASLNIAALLCAKNPTPILEKVMAEEDQAWAKCKEGGSRTNFETNEMEATPPEYEYRIYLEWDKPVHEILRQWCGYQSVTLHERRVAAEAEVHRLNILLSQALEELGQLNKLAADFLAEEHKTERISPYSIRSIPERPLRIEEIPVHIVSAKKPWWR